jgi:hypothetical protein
VFPIEQTLLFGAFNILRAGEVLYFLGRSEMNIRVASLFFATVLIAAAPAWADSVPYAGVANAGFRAEATSAVLIDSSAASNTLETLVSKPSVALDAFSPASTTDANPASLSDLASYQITSSEVAGKTWSIEQIRDHIRDHHRGRGGRSGGGGGGGTQVPEPGSLPLVLLGLLSLAFFARWRAPLPGKI